MFHPGGEFDVSVWKRWESGFGGIADEAQQYYSNWMQLKAIKVDYGEKMNMRGFRKVVPTLKR